MKKIVLFAVLTAMLCMIAAAGNFALGAEERKDIQNVQLSEDGKLNWDPYEGATRYWITFEPQAAFEPEGFSADLYQRAVDYDFISGSHSFTLVACDDNWQNLSKIYTGIFEYTAPVGLPSPVNLHWDGRIARWDQVDEAESYCLYLYSGESMIHRYFIDENYLDFSDSIELMKRNEYSFAVVALAHENGKNSEQSPKSPVIDGWFERKEIANVKVDENGILSWDAYEGATRYWLRFGEGAWEPDGLSIDLILLFAGSSRESGDYEYDLVACNDNWGELSLHSAGTYNYEKHLRVDFELPDETLFSRQAVKPGEKAVKPDDPAEENKMFSGWLLEDKPYDFDAAVTNNLTLVASFTDIPATDVPATDAPATDEPATDVPATDVPATDEPATDVPATDGSINNTAKPTAAPVDSTAAPEVTSDNSAAVPTTKTTPRGSSNKGKNVAPIIIAVLLGLAVAAGAVFAVIYAKKKKK